MAETGKRDPRTVLEHLLRQRDLTYEEAAKRFIELARSIGEPATISARHLGRLARGERSSAGTTPATRRVLRKMFDRPAEQLLRPWTPHGEVAQISDDAPLPLVDADDERRVLSMAAQRARRFALIAGQAGTTSDVIDQLRDDVQRLAIAYHQRPPHEILGDLAEVQDAVFTLLERRQRPRHASELYFLGSVVGGMLAKASHDLAEPHAAMTQARTAFLCADNADHNGLRAWLRGLQSLIAYWAGRTHEAVRYAQQGAEFALHSSNTTAVWLPMNEARAWAALGNAERARAAIRRGEEAWDRVQPDDLDELGGTCTFSRPRQLYYAADALVWLPEEGQEAGRYSAQAVEAYRDPTSPDWAFASQAGSHSDLAIARIACDELAGAAAALAPILELPPEQRINGIIHSLHRVHRALVSSAHSGADEARDLREQIEAFTRTPAAAIPR